MTVSWRVAYACLLVVSIAVALRLMHRRQRRLDLMRSQHILIGGAAFIGSMIGAKIPFLADRGWGAFLELVPKLQLGNAVLWPVAELARVQRIAEPC